MQQIALKALGLERNERLLQEGLQELAALENELTPIMINQIKFAPTDLIIKLYELENMTLVIKAAIIAALARTESRGAHYRLDYPKKESSWLKNITV
ncbi:hypothetical protein [Calderihabitans maritimus]|uniref:hypothetical protein n=1 Tax=Calderihabitans maritimus TaxID=1246530 RepID=UPI001864DE99|nr:hypothetical protein [Calderihabitans maritimus]